MVDRKYGGVGGAAVLRPSHVVAHVAYVVYGGIFLECHRGIV